MDPPRNCWWLQTEPQVASTSSTDPSTIVPPSLPPPPKKAAAKVRITTAAVRHRRGVRKIRLMAKKKKPPKPRGRPRLYVPQALRPEDYAAGEAFLKKWGPNTRTSDFAKALYRKVLELSGLEPTSDTLLGYLGQLSLSRLGPGSIETYFAAATKIAKKDAETHKLHRAVMRQHADAEVNSGADVEDKVLLEVVDNIPTVHKPAFEIMLLIGCRPCLLPWLRQCQIAPRHHREDATHVLHVQVRVDKNAWKTLHRNEISVPRAWLNFSFGPAFYSWHSAVSPQTKPFEGYDATKMNTILKETVDRLNAARPEDCHIPHLTNKAFRRAFFDRVFKACDGDTDKIASYTLHHSKYITKAHYYRWKGQKLPPMDGETSDEGEVEEVEEGE